MKRINRAQIEEWLAALRSGPWVVPTEVAPYPPAITYIIESHR